MSDFESSGVAGELRALWKPRYVHDPNRRVATQFAGALYPGRSQGVKARLARVVNRAPEVMVKVTGRSKGASHLAAHMDYIGRKGELTIETRDGELLSDKEDRHELAHHWGDSDYQRAAAKVAAVNMIFSMPEGTDPECVRAAVRAVADSEIADEWDYGMVLHTDTPRPHVHLTVAARGDSGRRFNPRPNDLHHYRERFAEELRDRGVSAEATPRSARGVGRASSGRSTGLHQMRARFRSGTAPAPQFNARVTREAMAELRGEAQAPGFVVKSKALWSRAQQVYLSAADLLGRSDRLEDRELARQVEAFARSHRVPSIHEQSKAMLAREIEAGGLERDRKPPTR